MQASERPSFPNLASPLSRPDTTLLHWSEKNLETHRVANRLGADLSCTLKLYRKEQLGYVASNNGESLYCNAPLLDKLKPLALNNQTLTLCCEQIRNTSASEGWTLKIVILLFIKNVNF